MLISIVIIMILMKNMMMLMMIKVMTTLVILIITTILSTMAMTKSSYTIVIRINENKPLHWFQQSHGKITPRLSNAFENSGVYQIALGWKDISVKVKIPGKRGFCGGESKPPSEKTILKNSNRSILFMMIALE